MSTSSLRFSCSLALLTFFAHVPAPAATVPLSSVQPAVAYSYRPAQSAIPQPANVSLGGGPGEPALRFVAESEVTYVVPTGAKSFSAVAIFALPPWTVKDPTVRAYANLLFRIEVDGKVVMDRGLEYPEPAMQFTVAAGAGQKLTLISQSSFGGGGGSFSLARAQFSSEREANDFRFLPAPGQGFVDYTPAARQGAVGAYFPGEPVTVAASFGGAATQANVRMQLSFEGMAPLELQLPMALKTINGIAHGSANWEVPRHQGPGVLTVDEEVNGQNVFHSQAKVAVIPQVDPSKITSSTFGIHISGGGYLILDDELAYLWGAKWARVFVRWPVLEPAPGQMDFSRIDTLVDLYRSQGMLLLVGLGEDAPAWAGAPGSPGYVTAWKQYVSEVVKHLSGRVKHWDVFNEVDVKYSSPNIKGEPNWDIEVLRTALQTIHAVDPGARTICCSTGTARWLPYDKRLYDAGLLKDVDILSSHPYRPAAPEVKLGSFTFLEEIGAPLQLAKTYDPSKSVIWATEANWIIGAAGDTSINSPGMPAREQAKYVVRVNLISQIEGVPYFLHAPFTHTLPRIYVDAMAAYANMTALMSGTSHRTMLASGPDLWAVYYSNSNGYVGAIWSSVPGAMARLSGSNLRFLDIDGNPINVTSDSISVSDSPVYFLSSTAPQLQVLQAARTTRWAQPGGGRWNCQTSSRCDAEGGSTHVMGQPLPYAYHLISSPISVPPGSCQVARVNMMLRQGTVGFFAIDNATGKKVGTAAYSTFLPDGKPHDFELRFQTGSTSSVKLVISNANSQPSAAEFSVSDFSLGNCD